MKRWVAATLLALAACSERVETVDPMDQCRATTDRAAQVAACSQVVDSADHGTEVRAEAYALRAVARQGGGEVTAALRDFEAALRLDEDNTEALLGRASILLASGQLDAAELLASRAADTSGRAAEMMGQIALRRSHFDDALRQFDRALEQAPRSASAMEGRARAKQALADERGAADDYDAAIRLDGTRATARAGRCWLDLRAGRNLERARNDAEAAVAADPRNVEAQLCRGVLQLRGGEWENARTSFDRVLDVEPGNPVGLFGRGVARRRSGESAGREDMNLARDFDRHIGETFDDLGVETY